MTFLVPLPVILPLLGAAATLALPHRARAQRIASVTALVATLVVAAALLVLSHVDGPQVMSIAGWPAPLGIVLVADRLAALMLVVSVTVTLCVLLYSIGEGRADVEGDVRTPLVIYYPTYLVLTAGVTNAFLSGDLFNLYVGFEILLAASYVLLTLGATEKRIRAGTVYVVVSLVSSLIFLTSIGLIYAATGTVNIAHLSQRLVELPDGLQAPLHLMLLIAFGIKAAAFPLSAWLPDSYPTAPAPVTAVFAGLLTKVGIYAIIRTETLLFPGGRMTVVLLTVALLTLIIGILGAIAQSDIKRLLSFTLVSHIGYLLFGVALGSARGMAGAIFYTVHHITIQTTLFLVAGLIERRAGSTSLNRLGGLARIAPVIAVLFFIPAMNLAGIPPLSGFVGKLGLLQAGVAGGGVFAWVLVAGSTLTSLLTLYAIMRIWNLVFWRTPRVAGRVTADPAFGHSGVDVLPEVATRTPATMVAPTAALVLLGLLLSVVAGPLFQVSAAAAADLIDRQPYVAAVLRGRTP